MKKLIIHADDFGLTEAVNEGIRTAIQNGPVTSTSLLVNFPASRNALNLARSENWDTGWHVNLTEGRPISPPESIPSLVQKNGLFHGLKALMGRSFLRKLNPREVDIELTAQLKIFLDAGIRLTHLDGHQHIHTFPVVRDVLKKIVASHRIPFVRLPAETGGISLPRFKTRFFLRHLKGSRKDFWIGTDARTIPFYGLSLGRSAGDLTAWKRLLMRIREEVAEIMVHPGLSADRHPEWTLLVAPPLRRLLQETGFETVRFRDLI